MNQFAAKHLNWLIVTDLDSTLQAPNEALLYGQWKVLQAFLALGGFLAIITGSSSENVVKRVGQWIEPSYRDRVLFFSENGAVCFRLGSLGPEYLYNLQPEFDAVRDEVEQAVVLQQPPSALETWPSGAPRLPRRVS